MIESSREFQVFVKPVGAECNLNCSYCYYLGKKDLYQPGRSLMSDEVLEKYIISHIEASAEKIIFFSWHGGEPMLAGIDFYRKAVSLQKRYSSKEHTIINGIQTNGTLLNDNWCRFFKKERFTVGISIDGPESLHNLHRMKRGGVTVFREVMRGYELLKQWHIPAEILCVVSSGNVYQPLAVYDFFRKTGAKYLTFLPLVEFRPGLPGKVSNETVPSEAFGLFLKTIFDQWVANDIGSIKIQIFEEALRTAFDQDHTLCIFKKECGGVPVVEHNGDFYSCDHYVSKEHLQGNIMLSDLSELLNTNAQREFGRAKLDSLPGYCHSCEVKLMCNGECPKNRFISAPSGETGLNYLCSGYKIFFNHCRPFIEAVRSQWLSQHFPPD
jgi:uncharacterized protein